MYIQVYILQENLSKWTVELRVLVWLVAVTALCTTGFAEFRVREHGFFFSGHGPHVLKNMFPRHHRILTRCTYREICGLGQLECSIGTYIRERSPT